jgi:hypothetical protein
LLIWSALLMCGVQPPPANAQTADEPLVFTQAEGRNAYAIYLEQNGQTRKLLSMQVDDDVNSATIETELSPDGRKLAFIPNYNSSADPELRVYDVATGAETLIEREFISSMAWSPDGAQLAYAVDTSPNQELRVSDGVNPGRTLTTVYADEFTVLGWTNDGAAVHVTSLRYDGGQMNGAFATYNLATNRLRPILVDSTDTRYHDVQLVDGADGVQYVSYIRSDALMSCVGSRSLVLAALDGTVITEYGVTNDEYVAAVWSDDGAQVAYQVRACIEKRDGLKAAEQRIAAFNGVYIADVTTNNAQRVITDVNSLQKLDALAQGTLTIRESRDGLARVSVGQSPLSSKQLKTQMRERIQGPQSERIEDAATASVVRNSYVPYVHQLWDTADSFNGEAACGPTSAVMTLAYFFLPASPMDVSNQYNSGTSDYGTYVSNQYTYNGTTYSRGSNDPSGNLAYGAYGHMVDNSSIGTVWAKLTSYLQLHGVLVTESDPGEDKGQAWVKARLDNYDVVIVTGPVNGSDGHLVVITGYNSDGTFIVNDPYGPGTDRTYKGGGVNYTMDQMAPRHFWAVTRS